MKRIRVLIVDDSILFRKVIIDNLSKSDKIEIIGYAIDAFDAQNKIPILKPDVITLDVEMPKVNGIEFLKKLMTENPIPVILVSSLNISVFDALSAGAIDFVKKPDMTNYNNVQQFTNEIIKKISIASNSNVKLNNIIRSNIYNKSHLASTKNSTNSVLNNTAINKAQNISKNNTIFTNRPSCSLKYNSMIIAIGASTGGTEATLTVLRDLPEDIPGIVITQHMPAGFTKMYAERLDKICNIKVKEAQNGDKILRGHAYVAPGDQQMKVIKTGDHYTISCFNGEKVSGHKPSVDVLFDSVADTFKSNAIGIILTGMGSDGAKGICKMKQYGAYTIGQNKESCVVYGMPMVAYNLGGISVQASCEQIPNIILQSLRNIK